MGFEGIPFSQLIAEVVDNRGRSCPTAEHGIPLIATNCIRNELLYPTYEKARFVSQETYLTWFRGHPRAGDILFVNKATPGRVCLVPDPVDFCIAQDMVAVRADPKKIYPKFLFAALRSPIVQDQIAQMHVGTLIPHFKKGDFDKLLIPVPDRDDQEFIGDIYFELSVKIALNRRMNATLEAMARALFKSWFVDFDPVRAKMEGRDTGLPDAIAALFPDRLGESELGEVPAGWDVVVLQDILAELETGGRPKGGVSGYTDGTPSIGAESIVGLGIFDYSKTKYVPRAFFDAMTKGRVRSRDVLLYKDGGRPGEFEPHVTMYGDGFPFAACAINEHVYRLRATEDLGQNFLFFWLSSDLVMEEMRIKGTGVAIPGLNSTQVKSLTTLLPTAEIIRAFDALIEPWIAGMLANCNESRTLAELRDALLPKLLSGEVRVGEAVHE
jgi:type I restriction enzyme, S subunit